MDTNPMLAANSGVVCFIGAMKDNEYFRVVCLNGHTGNVLWQTNPDAFTNIQVVSDGVYVTRSGLAGVAKYNLNGSVSWSSSIRGSGFKYMYIVDNEVQVSTDLDELIALSSSDGKLIVIVQGGT
jgi:outer membrane protein assembly factor BamB